MDFSSALANLQKTANAVKNERPNNLSRSPPHRPPGPPGGRAPGEDRYSSADNSNNHAGRGGGVGQQFDRRRPRDSNYEDGGRGRPTQRHRSGYRTGRPGGGFNGEDRPSSALDSLLHFGYRVNPYRPRPPPQVGGDRRTKHICLLALTIDDLPYEHIWKAWATSSDPAVHVSLVCHAKHPSSITSEWLKSRLLTRKPKLGRGNSFAPPEYFSHAPEWGSLQLTRAMIDALAQGLRIGGDQAPDVEADPRFATRRHVISPSDPSKPRPPMVDAFVFISETCLPMRSLDECVSEIFASGSGGVHSWVLARNRNTPGTPRNKYESDQFRDIHRMIAPPYRWKADQWLLLSRPHASAILNLDRHLPPGEQLWNSFAKISASDEMYFPTALAILGILTEAVDQEVVRRQVTYVNWSEGMRNPASYSQGVRDLVRVATLARRNGSLFARKFVLAAMGNDQTITGAISAEEWAEAMRQVTSDLATEEEVATTEKSDAVAEVGSESAIVDSTEAPADENGNEPQALL